MVSYAPRPMIMSVVVDSRVIIIVKDVKSCSKGGDVPGLGKQTAYVGQTGSGRLRGRKACSGWVIAQKSSVGAGMRRGGK